MDLHAACADLAAIAQARPLAVVHGVSATMDTLCRELGIEVQTLTSPSGHSSRYTPPALRDVYVQAAETVNQQIIEGLSQRDCAATGFIGAHIAVFGERKKAIRSLVKGRIRLVRDDYSGRISSVSALPLRECIAAGTVPVLPPMAQSADGALNVDGDRAAAAVAAALGADTLIILSNVRGLYRDFPREDSLVSEVPATQLESALGWAQGRMKRKVLAAQEALQGGVSRVIIADGRQPQPLRQALAGAGTRFSK